MIITKYFVYIHTSRTAGTFLNKLILKHMADAHMIQYHGHLRNLPAEFCHLPVIGFVRNPWDWYISMFFDYHSKKQYIFGIISENGTVGFEETLTRFLTLGDNSTKSKALLQQLIDAAPKIITDKTPPRRGNPGLRSEHFAQLLEKGSENKGYYSWLFQLMYQSKQSHRVHFGRFENLTTETLRLLELTGTPITPAISAYLNKAEVLNQSQRPLAYSERYSEELKQLVADKEKYLIDHFGYEFSETKKISPYPKADYFKHLGSVDIKTLIERVKRIPESLWDSENAGKANNFLRLNDTRHILFRYIDDTSAFDFHDHPLWHEWKDILLPLMEQAAKALGYKNYRFPRAMFARLPAGSEITSHADLTASHYIHKIHIPLITNPETTFHVGDQSKNLTVGEVVEVNNKRMHAVYNKGDADRIHFIFECYNTDDYGKPS